MKIFSVDQIREADKFTIKNEPITSIALMERAALACYEWIQKSTNLSSEVIVFCGNGNNGADGLAIARILKEEGQVVKVVVLNHSDRRSDNFNINYARIKDRIEIAEINTIDDLKLVKFDNENTNVIVDAILGSGINKPTAGLLADCIKYINNLPCEKISIDLPSGLFCDGLNSKNDPILNADYTLSFQFPKLSFMFSENEKFVGKFTILDIELSQEFISNTKANYYLLTKEDVRAILKKRNSLAHKGNFGHALIVSGSKGKMGAAVLSSKACIRSGTGLVTVRVPACGYQIIQITNPEAMADVDSSADFITDNIQLENYNAIGVGPGIGMDKQTQNVLKLLIQNSVVPIVFDADAINILAENKTWLSFIPPDCIFTPHIKEFERLVGKVSGSDERLLQQIEFSRKYRAYVVLKGAHTSISSPSGEVFFNSTGNPGMATGGSGDVLTGIITSLIAQKYSSLQACLLGVYLHGLAGDFASTKKTQETMVASDIIMGLSDAIKFIRA